MSSDIAIQLSNLSKCYQIYDKPQHRLWQGLVRGRKQFYREFWALKDVSFEVRKGETVGIIGRNGSGKSTLLQLICGTLTPNSGNIEVNGRVAALLELGAGFNPEFTGRENVYMNASILGLSKEEIDAKYRDIVAFADIGEFLNQPVKTYSSGMYVRLAFAVIAHVEADILVIDEALAVGDAFFTQKCMRFLRRFMETGTVLFVSHDSPAVVNLCKEAIWLDQGRIRKRGNAKKVTEAYLEGLYEEQRGGSVDQLISNQGHLAQPRRFSFVKDQRLEFMNLSQYRNDIRVFSFNPNSSSFGKLGARITLVSLFDIAGEPLAWVVGGEIVTLRVGGEAIEPLSSPIIGFYVKDRLGQALFGDNTYLSYAAKPLYVSVGERIEAKFKFQMPILPAGDYSICVALAEGTQQEHTQHQWFHDAVMLKSISSSVATGLVGIPMMDISLERVA
jgi:lipopolysaccharide transport system ATP-binding protein